MPACDAQTDNYISFFQLLRILMQQNNRYLPWLGLKEIKAGIW